MSKIAELAAVLVERDGLSTAEAERFIMAMFELVGDGLQSDDRQVRIKGLGTFKITSVGPRESIDVNTGERITIDERDKITFIPETSLKDRVNKPFSQFETVVVNEGADFSVVDDENMPQEPLPQTEKADDKRQKEEENAVKEVAPINESDNMASVETLPTMASADATADAHPSAMPQEQSPADTEKIDEESEKQTETEQKSSDTATTDDYREQAGGSNTAVWALSIILFLVVFFGALGAWYLWSEVKLRDMRIAQLEKAADNVVETPPIGNDTDAVETEIVGDGDVANKEDRTTAAGSKVDAENADNIEATDYDSDPQVRTGAYRIIGVDLTVKARKGQTLRSISKYYLGEGMECYVRAINGKSEFEEGEEVKIPKLELKKRASGR